MTILNRVPRVLVGAAVAGALMVGPMAALAHGSANFDSAGARKTGSELSVQINNNGSATVRGAKINSINGSTVVAGTSFGSTTVNWTVTTDGSTKFVDKGGRTIALSNMKVGDVVSFSGTLNANAPSLTVAATTLKDWSYDAKILEKHTFEGKLQAAVGTTSLPTTFNLLIGGANYLVQVAANTPILTKNWATTNLGTFVAGDNVRVYGSVQAANLTTIDAVVVRNASR